MSAGLGPWQGQEMHRSRVEQSAENSARLAWSVARVTSTGWGEFVMPAVVEFEVTFLEQPVVSYGYALNNDVLVATRYPRSCGFVERWQTNAKGFYTGCWIGLVVETRTTNIDTLAAEPNYTLDHHFTFTGVAYKDLPQTLLMDTLT